MLLFFQVSRIPDGMGPPVLSESEDEILDRTHDKTLESPDNETQRLIR